MEDTDSPTATERIGGWIELNANTATVVDVGNPNSGRWNGRTQWTAAVEAKAIAINHHKSVHWGTLSVGKLTCVNTGCDRKTTSVCCNKCFARGLRNLSRIPAYRAYVRQWKERDYEGSRPSLLSYFPRHGGTW